MPLKQSYIPAPILKLLFSICIVFNCIGKVRFVQVTCDETEELGVCKQNTWLTHDASFKSISDVGNCNIDRVNLDSNEEFLTKYAFTKPVIVTTGYNQHFQSLCEKSELLEKYGNKKITLSTANTHSYDKAVMSLKQYIDTALVPQDIRESGKNTLYFFGDNNRTEWKELFDEYKIPKYTLPGKEPVLSFGIGGIGSGVPFHFHGPGFAEVIHGSKRWFLYEYDNKPYFDPDQTTLAWVKNEYPQLSKTGLFECTIYPGEAIYFPNRWWHATLNLETSVFISTFLG